MTIEGRCIGRRKWIRKAGREEQERVMGEM